MPKQRHKCRILERIDVIKALEFRKKTINFCFKSQNSHISKSVDTKPHLLMVAEHFTVGKGDDKGVNTSNT